MPDGKEQISLAVKIGRKQYETACFLWPNLDSRQSRPLYKIPDIFKGVSRTALVERVKGLVKRGVLIPKGKGLYTKGTSLVRFNGTAHDLDAETSLPKAAPQRKKVKKQKSTASLFSLAKRMERQAEICGMTLEQFMATGGEMLLYSLEGRDTAADELLQRVRYNPRRIAALEEAVFSLHEQLR